MQGNVAFSGDVEDPIFQHLGHFLHKDGFQPVDADHPAALFEMLLPSIM